MCTLLRVIVLLPVIVVLSVIVVVLGCLFIRANLPVLQQRSNFCK
ncbi:hypothetical protein BCF53_10855 [Reinekea marinisedimentorum]|uniref:Uncharacterized protein n=1 Tax=Reinekea marinisedimentorum TaxID=230495 RepID=A0A4V2UJM8_9GAMM|nr:hypothetical protein BCF53_10855 [Reinekea marinisedimentorum]